MELTRSPSQVLTVARLAIKAADYAKAAKSTATIKAYASQWRAFESWCESVSAAPLPAAPGVVALYLTHRAEAGSAVATMAQCLTAISRAHVSANHPSPRLDETVREVWHGIRREHGEAQEQAKPLLPDALRRLVKAGNGLAGARDRALLLLGFAGALRRAELVGLDVADVRDVAGDGLVITVRRSKTDQLGKGREVGIPYGSDRMVCPVRALRAWLELAEISEGAIFRGARGGRLTPHRLDGRDVSRIVQRAAKRARVKPDGYSGHSLRAGLVTAASKAGKSLRSIQDQTGHKSLAMVLRYVRSATIFEDNAADGIL